MLATSLIKLILVAKKALAAYLIISAELRSVTTTGTGGKDLSSAKARSTRGAYNFCIISIAFWELLPKTMRSGLKVS